MSTPRVASFERVERLFPGNEPCPRRVSLPARRCAWCAAMMRPSSAFAASPRRIPTRPGRRARPGGRLLPGAERSRGRGASGSAARSPAAAADRDGGRCDQHQFDPLSALRSRAGPPASLQRPVCRRRKCQFQRRDRRDGRLRQPLAARPQERHRGVRSEGHAHRTIPANDPSAFFVDDVGRIVFARQAACTPKRWHRCRITVPQPAPKPARPVEEIPSVVGSVDRTPDRRRQEGEISHPRAPTGNFSAPSSRRSTPIGWPQHAGRRGDDRQGFEGHHHPDRDGKPLSRSCRRAPNYQFDEPVDLAFDQLGHLYVLDRGKASVYVFGPKNRLITTFTLAEKSPGAFTRARSFGLDAAGRMYIFDERAKAYSGLPMSADPPVASRRCLPVPCCWRRIASGARRSAVERQGADRSGRASFDQLDYENTVKALDSAIGAIEARPTPEAERLLPSAYEMRARSLFGLNKCRRPVLISFRC